MSDLTNIKSKIFNDPLYGFISIHRGIIFDVIEHPWFQRLRRINQLGLTNVVYTGANHTRFQHTLGAYHLMQQAIQVIIKTLHQVLDHAAEHYPQDVLDTHLRSLIIYFYLKRITTFRKNWRNLATTSSSLL